MNRSYAKQPKRQRTERDMSQENNSNPEHQEPHWVGFDLGGTKMLSVVYDKDFKALGRERKKTKGFEGADAGVKRIKSAIYESLEDGEVNKKQLAGIGVGCPGMLDLEHGELRDAPNLGWKRIPLRKLLEDEFDCPVIIGNDVDIGVYGEYRFGAGRGNRCVVGIFPGTGVGGGCVYEGNIICGMKMTCMEIGHIPIVPSGPLDGCNREGSLESLSSRLAIAAQAAQAAYRGQAPKLMSLAGPDVSKIRSGVIAESIEGGDRAVQQIVEKAARHIGQAAITVVHLLAPDVLVLGGGLVEAMPNLFVKQVSQTLQQGVLPSFKGTCNVVAAELGDDATVKGAAAWAAHRLLQRGPL